MPTLTRKQQQLLAFIEKTNEQKGVPPTFREIQKHFEFSSLGTVYSHIQALKKKKLLEDKRYAGLELTKEKTLTFVDIPIIGEVMQGEPPKIWTKSLSYTISKSLLVNVNAAYIFRSKGESLHSELIDDDDLLIVQAGLQPEDGDQIFALVESSVIIKTYFKNGADIRLESRMKGFAPLFFKQDHLVVQGVITAVIRSLL